jgi:hypothetical protein
MLIQGAVFHGVQMEQIEEKINAFIMEETLPEGFDLQVEIQKTAGLLSKELLYMKFLQGIPIVGAVGGAYDITYMKNISDYAKPISKPFEKVVEGGFVDFANIESLRDIEGQLNFVSKRCYGINFSNLSNYADKHTIEFRIPNGTVNPNTWIENINLFGNLLKKCQTITEIRKKDKDQLTPEDKTQLKVYNVLVFGDLTMDDRAELLIDFVLPESQQKTFHDRYFVNSKLLNMQEGIKSFLSNETFAKPIDVADLKQKLFEKEGRVTGLEYAVCTSILAHELQSMKGMNHEY